jgi:hypothetical protein
MSHKSISKTEKVRCRVESCKEEVSSQNYKRHLIRYHPHEDSKDKRSYGHKMFSFGRNTAAVKNAESTHITDKGAGGQAAAEGQGHGTNAVGGQDATAAGGQGGVRKTSSAGELDDGRVMEIAECGKY